MSSKRQQTMAKLARERRVQEKRVLKAEKKQARKDAAAAAAEGGAETDGTLPEGDSTEPSPEPEQH